METSSRVSAGLRRIDFLNPRHWNISACAPQFETLRHRMTKTEILEERILQPTVDDVTPSGATEHDTGQRCDKDPEARRGKRLILIFFI